MQECSVLSLVCLLFPWEQCQSLKPVLSQCSQTGFVTVDDFIALYTCSHVFYSHGYNKFLHERTFFTLVTIAPIFTMITEVWPRANRAVVTNNSTVISEVVLIKAVLIEGFLYSLPKKIRSGPLGAPFCYFFIIQPQEKKVIKNDVEYDFSIGHALVLFVFMNNKQKMEGEPCNPSPLPPKLIYNVPNTLFLVNLMIIIMGT